MAEYIENVSLGTAKLDWAFPFQRTGSFPLDRSSMFSSLEDAILYASGGNDSRGLSGSSYAGQPISVYDAENGTIELYIIDYDRSLKPVGSSTKVDENSIEVIDGKLQIKSFGTEYYAFTPAIKDAEGNTIQASSYTLTEGFKEGLEPRAKVKLVNDEIVYEIAWYEPSSETLDGFAAQLEALNNTVDNKANKTDVYTKTEVESLIAESNHLKYKKVDSINDIDVNAKDASQYIYLVLVDTSVDGDDKYDEYMVIDSALEKVGSWDVKLDDYALKTDLNNKVDKIDGYSLVRDTQIEKLETVGIGAEENYIKTVNDEKFTVSESGQLDLKELKVSDIEGLSDKLDKALEEGDLQAWIANNREVTDGLLSADQEEKLSLIEDGAQKNLFDSVNEEQMEIVEDDEGKLQLTLKEISVNQIANLEDLLNGKVSRDEFEELETDVGAISTSVAGISETVNTLSENIGTLGESVTTNTGNIATLLNNYNTLFTSLETVTNTVEDHTSRIENLEDIINDYVTRTEYDKDMQVILESITWNDLPAVTV